MSLSKFESPEFWVALHEDPMSGSARHEESGEEFRVQSSDSEFVQRARTKYGAMGAIVASSMLGLDKLLGRKPKDDGAVVWEASGEPEDIDRDGISISIDETTTAHTSLRPHGRGRHVRKRRYQE